MENMRFKVGDRVRIKSLDWYNENKTSEGCLVCGESHINPEMINMLGKIVTISSIEGNHYRIKEYAWNWTDEMIEGLVEEENNNITETVVDTVKESNDRYRMVIDPRFDIEVDEGEYYAVRRKREYPKTYEECCKVLNVAVRDLDILDNMLDTSEIIYRKNLDRLLNSFRKLLICRDAYWKIAGDEMRLNRPWKPRWNDGYQKKWTINFYQDEINLTNGPNVHFVLAFPTEEMRDAFYENFKELIKICKELL